MCIRDNAGQYDHTEGKGAEVCLREHGQQAAKQQGKEHKEEEEEEKEEIPKDEEEGRKYKKHDEDAGEPLLKRRHAGLSKQVQRASEHPSNVLSLRIQAIAVQQQRHMKRQRPEV
ncbi:hypothetical protein EC968_008563 [Mortierella alpina]|nr:hypothetical protein EC968_008563 [Mortierella alpina]